MTSGALLIIVGVWVILQVTKGGLVDRIGIGDGGTVTATADGPTGAAALGGTSATTPAAGSSTPPAVSGSGSA